MSSAFSSPMNERLRLLLAALIGAAPSTASAIQPLDTFLAASRGHNFDNREAVLTARVDA